eukprot:COSAG02_NODE_3724_length_6321_cov_1.932819_3_plen_64_part_00
MQQVDHGTTHAVAALPSVSDPPTTPKDAIEAPAMVGGALATTVSKVSTADAATTACTNHKNEQ